MQKSVALFSLIALLASRSYASPAEPGNLWKRDPGCKTFGPSMGCNAFGPLSGSRTVLVANCEPGAHGVCQATDSTGCNAGDPSNIESLIIRDLSDATALGGSASVAAYSFTCPPTGMISCAVIFTAEGVSKAGQYGLMFVESSSN